MTLQQQFSTKLDIHNVHYCIVNHGMITLNNVTYAPEKSTMFNDGDTVRVYKMPESLTFNKKRVIMVRGERWLEL